ncbi:MAG: hypothetical protein R3E99_02830 [Burkholderiaceae bacterium]
MLLFSWLLIPLFDSMDVSGDKDLTPIKRPRSVVEMTLYGSLLVIVFLAYLVPLDVLQKYPQFVPFVDFMASWNTQIRRVGEISGPRSQVNMFIYSMTWCLIWIPVICFLWMYLLRLKLMGWRLNTDDFGFRHLMIFVGVIFYTWLAYTKPTQREPIISAAGRMIYMSPITSPVWSVVMVLGVIFALFGCLVIFFGFFQKIYRHFRG